MRINNFNSTDNIANNQDHLVAPQSTETAASISSTAEPVHANGSGEAMRNNRAGESSIATSSLKAQLNSATGHVDFSALTNARQPKQTATNLQVLGDASFRAQVAKDLAEFAPGTTVDSKGFVHAASKQTAGHTTGYELINNLLNNNHKVSIGFTANDAHTLSDPTAQGTPKKPNSGSDAHVEYDPKFAQTVALPTLQKDGTIKDQPVDSAVVLAHELVHATHAQRGTIDRSMVDHVFSENGKSWKESWRFEEFRTTGFSGQRQTDEPSENSIRAELGFQPRAAYTFRNSWTPAN